MRLPLPRLLGWRVPRTTNMTEWGESRLIPLEEQYVSLIKKGDQQGLHDFAKLCHRIVQDRDLSFTLEHRTRIYARWLSSGQPCLQMASNKMGCPIGASIILPLTQEAYDMFCFGKLDALNIEAYHIDTRKKPPRRYLLVDMLAVDKALAQDIPAVGFRIIIRHIARFYNLSRQSGPVVLCATENKLLVNRLREFEFQRMGKEQGTSAYIYRADLSNLDLYSPSVREYYSQITSNLINTHKA